MSSASRPPKPVALGPFTRGMNNRAPDTDLDTREGSFLRSAVNVDITPTGRIKRRQGYELALAGTNIHSLCEVGGRALFVDGSTLYELKRGAAGVTKTAIRSGFLPHSRLSFCELNGLVVYTDGRDNRTIDAAGNDRALSVPPPNPAPVLADGGEGGLHPGLYQVCMVFERADGTFSGSTTPSQTYCSGKLLISSLPTTFPAGVVAARIYLTPCDGNQFMHWRALGAPVAPGTVFELFTPPSLGHLCPTFMKNPLPPGAIIRRTYGGARLLVAAGKHLYYSDPFAQSMYDPLGGYVPFESEITMLECGRGGIYVGTDDATFRLPDDPSKSDLETLLPYGAVRGASGTSPDRTVCWWMTTRGLVRAGAEGQRSEHNLTPVGGEVVVNLQEEAIAMTKFRSGAAMFREQDGMKHVVSSLFDSETAGAAAYSYFDAEIIRKGTTL